MFKFDGNYDNEAQVEPYYEAFLKTFAEIEASGSYTYNDSFKGRVDGLTAADSKNEDTAIYLLQGLKRSKEQAARVVDLLTDGHEWVETVTPGRRYVNVALVPQRRMGGSYVEIPDARLVSNGSDAPYAVLGKGKRSHGTLVSGRKVLAKAVL